ncbi:MAG: quinolinate synthase NadA [Pirellulales bacterium]|nr:quinolinate synthase NadA [Pirellulales bacterium]
MNCSFNFRAEKAFDLKYYQSLPNDTLVERIEAVRGKMGSRLLVLAHHYQKDSIIALSDLQGDSYKLCELAAKHEQCEAIVFSGVHFMAETADILANRPEQLQRRGGKRVPVVLPDLDAGCSLAEMANIEVLESCWNELGEVIDVSEITPITYVNSTAAIKSFCGARGGIVCTSANAAAVLDWAFAQRRRVLFLPDQHLGRNTALAMGIPVEEMALWDPRQDKLGGNDAESIGRARVILWHGHCSVHQLFRPADIEKARRADPQVKIIVHPECPREVVELADASGSTGMIIDAVTASPAGTHWAVGTELNLVNRLKNRFADKQVDFLSSEIGICPTMYRIDLAHLCWALENLAADTPVNVIRVDDDVARDALTALERMLEVR